MSKHVKITSLQSHTKLKQFVFAFCFIIFCVYLMLFCFVCYVCLMFCFVLFVVKNAQFFLTGCYDDCHV